MSTIVQLVQGSAEWHAHRRGLRNASETPAVLGLSPWVTPYQLWLLKTGRAEPAVNAAMRNGTALEPLARHAYEVETGHVMQPLVLQDGLYSASLDGMTLYGDLIVEIKCPYKGAGSALWQSVEGGQVPDHYAAQIQHQLMVSGAAQAHVCSTASAGCCTRSHPSRPWPKLSGGRGTCSRASWTATRRRHWSMPTLSIGMMRSGSRQLRLTRKPSRRRRPQTRRLIEPRRLWWPWRGAPGNRVPACR